MEAHRSGNDEDDGQRGSHECLEHDLLSACGEGDGSVCSTGSSVLSLDPPPLSTPQRRWLRAATGSGQSDDDEWRVGGLLDVHAKPRAQDYLRSFFKWEELISADMFTSTVVMPSTLLFFRVVVVVWMLPASVVIGVAFWRQNPMGLALPLSLSYLSLLGLVLYFGAMAWLTYNFRITYKRVESYPYSVIQREPLTWHMKVCWVAFEILTPLSCVVAILYWSLLHPGESHADKVSGTDKRYFWLACSVHMHGLPAFLMLVETWFNHLRFVSTHVFFFLGVVGLYMGMALIYYAVVGEWVYFFLDYHSKLAKFYYPGILGGCVVVYFVARQLVSVRACLAFVQYRTVATNSRGDEGGSRESEDRTSFAGSDFGSPPPARSASVSPAPQSSRRGLRSSNSSRSSPLLVAAAGDPNNANT